MNSRQAHQIPGVAKPRRFRPRFHYELLICGTSGHELLGTDVRHLREQDRLYARENNGLRWHRCLRCDSWLPLPVPSKPTRNHSPNRADVKLPLRGKPLRDQVVLRLIAIVKGFKFVVLAISAVLIFILASHRSEVRTFLYHVLNAVQGTTGATDFHAAPHWLQKINHFVSLKTTNIKLLAIGVAAYAAIFGIEAVGLWLTRRWAEYFSVIATSALIPVEVDELLKSITPLKVTALILNIAIVVYLLFAKRLFGLRGGASIEREHMQRDVSWDALERTAPQGESVA